MIERFWNKYLHVDTDQNEIPSRPHANNWISRCAVFLQETITPEAATLQVINACKLPQYLYNKWTNILNGRPELSDKIPQQVHLR